MQTYSLEIPCFVLWRHANGLYVRQFLEEGYPYSIREQKSRPIQKRRQAGYVLSQKVPVMQETSYSAYQIPRHS